MDEAIPLSRPVPYLGRSYTISLDSLISWFINENTDECSLFHCSQYLHLFHLETMSIRICLFSTDFNPTITLLNPHCFRRAVSRFKPPCSSKSLAIRVLVCTFRSFSRRSLFPRSLNFQILVRTRNITLMLLFSHVQFFLQGRSKNYGCKLYSGFVSNWIFSNNACPLTCNLFSPL